jgi:hypothetical protein
LQVSCDGVRRQSARHHFAQYRFSEIEFRFRPGQTIGSAAGGRQKRRAALEPPFLVFRVIRPAKFV